MSWLSPPNTPEALRSLPSLCPPARTAVLPLPHPQLELDLLDEGGELAATKSRYLVAELPVRLPMVPRPPTDKPNPKLGVGEWPREKGGSAHWRR